MYPSDNYRHFITKCMALFTVFNEIRLAWHTSNSMFNSYNRIFVNILSQHRSHWMISVNVSSITVSCRQTYYYLRQYYLI